MTQRRVNVLPEAVDVTRREARRDLQELVRQREPADARVPAAGRTAEGAQSEKLGCGRITLSIQRKNISRESKAAQKCVFGPSLNSLSQHSHCNSGGFPLDLERKRRCVVVQLEFVQRVRGPVGREVQRKRNFEPVRIIGVIKLEKEKLL